MVNINMKKIFLVVNLHGDRLDGLAGGHRPAAVNHLHWVKQPDFFFFNYNIFTDYYFHLAGHEEKRF